MVCTGRTTGLIARNGFARMLPPLLKTEPKYGYFPWWPQDGDDWLHPDDVTAARSLIPSGRIFRRDGTDGDFLQLHYGDMTFRIRRTLWQEVRPEGLEVGDWVEVLAHGMLNTPRTGTIREMVWDQYAGAIRYQIRENDLPIEQFYSREDLKPVEPIG